jgi:methylglutaconyl-CoA hydratase
VAFKAIDVRREGPVEHLVLNRPAVRNAFDDEMIREVTWWADSVAADREVRVVVISGAGPVFCAGADVRWMARTVHYTHEENLQDATETVRMFLAIDRLPVPVIARVQGAALGGGAGLCAVADIVVAARDAVFGFTEVVLGILPAMISPYVVRAMGPRQARRWFLTGEAMEAHTAERIGLVHEAVDDAALPASAAALVDALLAGGPGAQSEIKRLLRHVTGRSEPTDESMLADTARWIARIRAGGEAREGLTAFLERRKPGWIRDA